MKKTASLLLAVLALAFLSQPLCQAQEEVTPPEGAVFTRINRLGKLTLRQCPLIDGVTRVNIVEKGEYVQLPLSMKRGAFKFARKYNYFSCADQGDGNHVIYARVRPYKSTFKYDLALRDFPRSSVSRYCTTTKSWPAHLIYKTVGSGHFYDCRRNTVGLVATRGWSGYVPNRIEILDTQGNNVGALSMYARGGLYAWRAYACIGGTPARNGAAVAGLARRNTGSPNVYFDFGSTCYGPVPADKCIGSSQC